MKTTTRLVARTVMVFLAWMMVLAFTGCGKKGVAGNTYTGIDDDDYKTSYTFNKDGSGQMTAWDDDGDIYDSGSFTYTYDKATKTVTIIFSGDTYHASYDKTSLSFSKKSGDLSGLSDGTVFRLDGSKATKSKGGKGEIDQLLDSYDQYITKLEKAVKEQDEESLEELMESAVNVAGKLAALESSNKWTQKHTERLAQITTRYTKIASDMAVGLGVDLSDISF